MNGYKGRKAQGESKDVLKKVGCFMKLKDYPLTSALVKNYDETRLVAKSLVPEEWLDYEIVHTYVDEELSVRVLVVRKEEEV